eukprot:g6861.t2
MASKALAAVLCAFAPCSGFVSPAQLRNNGAAAPSLYAPNTAPARPHAPPPNRSRAGPRRALPRDGRGRDHDHGGRRKNGAATGWGSAAEPRVGRRLYYAPLPLPLSTPSSRRGPDMTVAGGEGGCEMEGEVVGDGAVARTEEEGEGCRDADDAAAAGGGGGGGGTEADQSVSPMAEGSLKDTTSSSSSLPGSADSSVAVTPTSAAASEGAQAGLDGASGGGGSGGGVAAEGDDSAGGGGKVAGGAGAGASGAGVGAPNRRREAPLTEREGFAVAKKVLPGGGEGLEMDLEALRVMRSEVNKLKRSMRQAVEEEDYKKAGELRNEVAAIRAKVGWVDNRGSVFEVDRLVCLGDKASNIITTDPEGATVRRFLRNDQVGEISRTGQIQLPVWSPDGKMVAFSVLKAGSGGAPIESAKILVYRESGSLVLDVAVPRAPFLLMWSPNSQSLTYLSNAEGPGGATIRLSEILVAAASSPYKTKTRGLAQGNPLFYAYTKKDTRNSDMVVHTANRVYFLDMTAGTELDISSRAAQLFMAPSTHCEGGEDAVILVETDGDESGQHLVSARVDGSAKKRLCPTRGFSTFGVSPDGQRLCLMQQDMTTGFYTISVLEGGEGALDPLSTSTMEQVEIPLDRVIMAFFFSPDSTKLLCLATKMSKSELAVARSSMRLGFQLKFQWVIYDCETRNVQLLEEFSPRPFFLKMYLPYFDMFAQGFTPWAPDSKSFTYVSADAAFVQEVPDDGLAPMPRELGPNMEFVSWSFC